MMANVTLLLSYVQELKFTNTINGDNMSMCTSCTTAPEYLYLTEQTLSIQSTDS